MTNTKPANSNTRHGQPRKKYIFFEMQQEGEMTNMKSANSNARHGQLKKKRHYDRRKSESLCFVPAVEDKWPLSAPHHNMISSFGRGAITHLLNDYCYQTYHYAPRLKQQLESMFGEQMFWHVFSTFEPSHTHPPSPTPQA
jgi:hypothetical protein